MAGDVAEHGECDAAGVGAPGGVVDGDAERVGAAGGRHEGETRRVACRGEPVGAADCPAQRADPGVVADSSGEHGLGVCCREAGSLDLDHNRRLRASSSSSSASSAASSATATGDWWCCRPARDGDGHLNGCPVAVRVVGVDCDGVGGLGRDVEGDPATDGDLTAAGTDVKEV